MSEKKFLEPLYVLIKEELLARIRRGEWGMDSPLPAEGELAVQYKASRGTIRRAFDDLVAEGIVIRTPGKGTFVARPGSYSTRRASKPMSQSISFAQHIPGARTEVLEKRLIKADVLDASIMNAFGIHSDAQVIHIKRLRIGSVGPISIQSAYLLAEEFPNILDEDLTSLSKIYEQYGCILTRGTERLKVRPALDEERKLLDASEADPPLVVARERYSLDQGGQLIEVLHAIDHIFRYIYKYDFVNDLTFESYFETRSSESGTPRPPTFTL